MNVMPFSVTLLRCFAALILLVAAVPSLPAQETLRALIVDGQNNHGNWPDTSRMMKNYLEQSGRFTVDVATTAAKGTDADFRPAFEDYDVVVSNYNGTPWPEETQQAFVDYMQKGGGFVVVHAADNAFPQWEEYNRMIGLGGWGGRNQDSGPYVYFNGDGKIVRDTSSGNGGSHGPQHEFSIVVRDDEHPITKGLPREWMHANDELYDKLRGPGENLKVLATAFSAEKFGGTGRHEPMLMTVEYGDGRVFHTPMGHGNDSQECVGFITVLQRGAEWAATGQVTLPVPDDFPSADRSSSRKFQPQDIGPESLRQDLDAAIQLLRDGKTRELIEFIMIPEEASRFFLDKPDAAEAIAAFGNSKAPRLLVMLEAIDIEQVQFLGDEAETELEGRPVRFVRIDGHWRIKN